MQNILYNIINYRNYIIINYVIIIIILITLHKTKIVKFRAFKEK